MERQQERQRGMPKGEQPHESYSQSSSFENSQIHPILRDLVNTRVVAEDSKLYRSLISLPEVILRAVNYERQIQSVEHSQFLQGKGLSQSFKIQSNPNELANSQEMSKEDSYHRHHIQNQYQQLLFHMREKTDVILRLWNENRQIRSRAIEEENRNLQNLSEKELKRATAYYSKKQKEYEEKYKEVKEQNGNISAIFQEYSKIGTEHI